MFTPTFFDFFVDHLTLFITGGCIVMAGFLGAALYVRRQGEENRRK
jgi:hypothetical protein